MRLIRYSPHLTKPGGPSSRPRPGADLLQHVVTSVTDYMNFNALAWPAFDAAGQPVVPPAEHILDKLARAHDLAPEDEINTRPGAGTVAILHRLPACDLCGAQNATYDGKLEVDRHSRYAYFCHPCYSRRGSRTLGASGDVYLITYAEVPVEVRLICDEIIKRLGRPSIWSTDH